MNKIRKYSFIIAAVMLCMALTVLAGCGSEAVDNISVEPLDSIEEGGWQGQPVFPDRKGYVDDTLAMNSMYSFDGYEDQGRMYIEIDENVESFDLFIKDKITSVLG